jgi:hypothetical protein
MLPSMGPGLLGQAGAVVEEREVTSLDELEGCDVIINCLGLGAARLFGDPDIYPVRCSAPAAR